MLRVLFWATSAIALLMALSLCSDRRPLPNPAPVRALTPKQSRTRTAPSGRPPTATNRAPAQPIEGRTRFLRRLSAGTVLCEAPLGERRAAFERVRKHLLHVDHAPAHLPLQKDAFEVAYARLIEPRRDRDALRCTPKEGALVRVWTMRGEYPRGELRDVTHAIRGLLASADAKMPGGFDVLATPNLVSDLFPEARSIEWAAGVYYSRDDFSTVRINRPAPYRRRTLQHELVHAICFHLSPSFRDRRAISEGLAGYLSLARTPAAHIHRGLLADDMAALVRILDRLRYKGISVERMSPQALLALAPYEFYALRSFSYLLAEGAMAYVGRGAVKRALRSRSPAALERRIAAIRWPEFEAFVLKTAARGRAGRATVPRDAPPRAIPVVTKRSALARLGVAVPAGVRVDGLDVVASELFSHPDQQREVGRLLGAEQNMAVVFDRSATMRKKDVRERLRGWARDTWALFALDGGVVPIRPDEFDVVHEHRLLEAPSPFARWLASRGRSGVLLFIGSGATLDAPQLKERTARWLAEFRAAGVSPGPVFITDFVSGGGEGRAIATALYKLAGRNAPIAYESVR